MSKNTELVIRGLSAATRRPKPDYDIVNALFHADHVLVPIGVSKLGESEAKGGQGYRDWLAANEQAISFELKLDGAIEIGPDTVMASGKLRIHGASSGVDVERQHWIVAKIADDQIIRTESFMEAADAFQAAQPSE